MAAGVRTAGLLYLAAGALWALAGWAPEYPAFGPVLLELFVAAWLFPAARLQLRTPLSPRNWAIFLFHIHLVVAPLLGMGLGFERGTLLRLPSTFFINAAMLLSALAHLCFALGAQLGASRPAPVLRRARFSPRVHAALAALFILLGTAGLWLTFGSLEGYLQYVTVPETHAIMAEAPPTLGGALGTFLRPFLTFGLLLLWSNHIARTARPGRCVISTLLLLAALLPATASYNRASMWGPVLAALAAYSLTVRRLSGRAVAAAGVAMLLLGLAFGAYREENLAGPDAPVRERRSTLEEANSFIQVYGEGPQFLGFLLEQTKGEDLHLGRTLFSSVLYPLPVLGKPFRDSSGVHFYNRLVYGRSGIVDQIIPAAGELFLNFHLPGVAAFFGLLGLVVQRIERRFETASTAFTAAAFFHIGMWVSFAIAGSVAVVSQILIYMFWPLYGYFGLRAALNACRARPVLRLRETGAPP
jgi:hypothetical protein